MRVVLYEIGFWTLGLYGIYQYFNGEQIQSGINIAIALTCSNTASIYRLKTNA